jgi:hypothetical protein
MKEVVLFATAGRSDLQVLRRDADGKLCRAEVDKTHTRAFHEALLTGHAPYQVNAAGIGEEPNRAVSVHWDAVQQVFKSDVLKDAQERYILTPAKLAWVVNALRSRPELHVAAVVLFNTHRTDPGIRHAYQEEPIAVGPVLACWLAEEFGLASADSAGTIGLGQSGWINILDGSLQSPDTGRDSPIHREAVRRMDQCLRDASR